MFKEHTDHRQGKMFGIEDQMNERVKARLEKHWSKTFYLKVFCAIDERIFAPLYHHGFGRGNFPVNILASLEIIKEMLAISDEDLIDRYYFDLSIRSALGLADINEHVLSPRTLYYFREAIAEYELAHNINLVMELFKDGLDDIITEFGIKTGMQRTDSTMIGANIKRMSRLTLFHKVLSNLVKEIEKNKGTVREEIRKIVSDDEDAFAYRLKKDEVEKYLKEMGGYILELIEAYRDNALLKVTKSYRLAKQVLGEHCLIEEDDTAVELKKPAELSASSVQNPSDPEATYRVKNKESHRGYSAHAVETCDPENNIHLILDVCVVPNTADDAAVLSEKIEGYKNDFGLETMIADGGFVSDAVRQECACNEVELVATAIKGKKAKESNDSEIITTCDFVTDESTGEIISCPMNQAPLDQKFENNIRTITFDSDLCRECVKHSICPVNIFKKESRLIIDIHRAWIDEREKKLGTEEYRKLCNLRPPVEGLMSRLKPKYLKGRTLFRGKAKVQRRIIYKAMGLNFNRIQRVLVNSIEIFLRLFFFGRKFQIILNYSAQE
jgi:hypothetical protein